ncbi:protein-L-isoaspartate O-methyltransferase [Tianweitania sp. BSSL-BM11]|uniref:Protein-L-isoaspartate O-methyltransferase n=1 Tax=Tianweitania aestuarii TaxID=2814886 RepID=A0ABS5RVJ5_9HYPH|nr:protein-L-isoaspartate O-methyltransferase [Tianweitania aestuarii]MBS9720301.1 protein-L-isoaspartate O-methyltransferase [Tianweitania aestuarii]
MSVDFATQRLRMVDGQVRTTDVTSLEIIDAMLAVPREDFVPARKRALSYVDEDLEIAPALGGNRPRFLMEASPFAKMLQMADIRPGDFVLDVGAGTGYGAAILSHLASSVVALESDTTLAEHATTALQRLGYDNVAVVNGELNKGYPTQGPYDVIVVEGSVDEVPQVMFDQLKEHGRLVAVVGRGNSGSARLYVREGKTVSGRPVFNAAVQPLPGFDKPAAFQF